MCIIFLTPLHLLDNSSYFEDCTLHQSPVVISVCNLSKTDREREVMTLVCRGEVLQMQWGEYDVRD